MDAAVFSFGPFTLHEAAGLARDGRPVQLGARALALLSTLAEAAGATVTKEHLLARAWPGVTVEEGNLTVQVAALRKALGDRPDGGEWIVTVPRVGYRLVTAEATRRPEASLPERPALAVLPFLNLGGDAEHDWFVDGVVDDIITALSRFHSFAVIARNSAFTYKGRNVDVRQVARELGVRYVMEGSLQRAGERLRITAQLVDGEDGAHLWAERFDGVVADVFDFQDRITESVATVVGPRIQAAEIARSRRERPGSIAVYDLRLRALAMGDFTWQSGDDARAYTLLKEALALEPDNALLLAHAAWALGFRIAFGQPPLIPDGRAVCIELARRSLAQSGRDAVAMAYCSMVLVHVAHDYDRAMAVAHAATEANPNNLTVANMGGVTHLHCGSIEIALACFHRANRLSPRDPLAHVPLTGIAHAHVLLGNNEEALIWAARSLVSDPSYPPTYWMLIAANAHLGRLQEARRQLETYLRLAPHPTIAAIRSGQPAKDPSRIEPILQGLRLGGMAEA